MVSSLSIFFMFVSLIISFLVPIALAIYICRVKKASVVSVLVGGLIFFVFQIITRIPLLKMLEKEPWYNNIMSNIWIYILFLSITAGLFEEVGRFLGFKFLLKNKLDWKNGVAFGIGHGGIEAIYLLGFTSINNIVYSFMINGGIFDTTIGSLLPLGVGDYLKEQLINLPSAAFLAGGVERLFTIVVHIAFSLIVLMAVKRKQFKYVIYSILLHAFLNGSLVTLMYWKWNIWIVEGILGTFVLIALKFIMASRERIDEDHGSFIIE
ncbi:YhfC family intramembrane metalloprotease [Alkaliphilus serpentinus]|uniref:YhfC family intramembrane metalloprotease n=1 Tax=Alkaliphilus serpentinus TaxID=1482731 RepID=A0A833M9J3_9FIRM|nr:YhfC family glutamic-type intramembrane protease [Alkaliphilus serpentinus]KAB3528830.1 YhfC family intramembrane metalloprotease [Alkaliphilus serpentinus]